MNNRGAGIAGNPVLIGAATVLVILVAVFLAYNANQGLPFVPTYSLKAEVPSAAALVRGNEVRIGGARVGTVDGITTKRQDDGSSVALLSLKLERDQMPLPKDSTLLIRTKSALGLKYVEVTRGRSDDGFGDGDTIPLEAATPAPVEFDEFVNMFDDETREAMRTNIEGFGTAFAGRGTSINQAIAAFRPLLADIIPVAQNLSDPNTNLDRFIGELGDAAAEVAPAAEEQAELFVNLDTTMAALREVARPYIQDSITKGRPALDEAIRSFPIQRPFLANSEGLFRELRPGVRALRTSAPVLADALEIGTPTLRRSVALNRRLEPLLRELQTFAEDPRTELGVDALSDVVRTLRPTLAHLAPAQLQCNYVTLWFRNVSSLLSEGDKNGTWQRFIIIATPQGPNSEGGPSSAPADGPDGRQPPPHQPVSEHGLAEAAQGVRGRQRALRERQDRDRQRVRHAAGPDGEDEPVMARGAVKRHTPRSPVAIGLIALVIILVGTFLGFTKDIPFTTPYQVKATFESANSIRVGSPVRIAGVNVGKVASVEAGKDSDTSVVTLSLQKQALPIHEDATAKIRPRIFLEGNFFVDLRPGTPAAPELDDGGVIKVTHTSSPVQLDEVLTSLQSDTRQDLKDVLDGLAQALNSKPTAADDRDAAPSARGETGAESFNDAYVDIPAAERSTAQVFEAFLGQEPGEDLSRLIDGTARTSAALIRHEEQLKDLITNFNRTTAAFASEADNLQATIRLLAPTLENANTAFASLNAAFPPTRAFAREILPGVRETPATIEASFPWIAQTRKLVSASELGGLVKELSPATRDLARLTNASLKLLPQTTLTSRCARQVILPTGDIVIRDEFETGVENYKEFMYGLVGLAGEGQNFDGNGMYVRFQPGGGSQAVSLGAGSPSGEVFGNNIAPPLGNRPFYPGKRPPYRPDVKCHTNKLPNLNGPAAAKTDPTTPTAQPSSR